ncbi:hypothetical protein I316_05655 [Kwoniella heveanensis BCC8398]|uniref:DNA-directed RNA polymerase n=1 Tax=Kwoniella heveanensis BCC8398 TaxID=1296120 RepID=A0A1B9GNQ0_9TREE|nr:hypothetical protein I316_05655 [Kwoniella heveanensis BCC8398]
MFANSRLVVLSTLLAASSAMAHCQLAWPFPLHSPLNPATPEAIKDYSMTSPLISSGTYPCKGYINNPSSDMDSVASFSAGSPMNFTIAGTATHGGGSCQISMSYDLGATWNVIWTQMGGCLVDGMTNTIDIPSEAPSGEALFAWGWFNRLGNREMYHNCAVVTITNGGSGLNEDDFPTPFVANANVNDCATIEGVDVVFPNPGKNVKYGGDYASSKPTTPAGYTGSNCVGPGATEKTASSGSSSGSSSASSAAPSATTSADSAGISIGVSASIGLGIGGDQATATSTGSASENTEYTLSLSPDTTSLGDANAIAPQPTASSTAGTSSGGKTCKAKQSRRSSLSTSHSNGGIARRHQRLIRRARQQSSSHEERDTKRVAASKAEHISHTDKRAGNGSDGIKRVAAQKATHNLQVRNGVIEVVRS